MTCFEREISKLNIAIERDLPLSKHSSFKIGGPARYALFPDSEEKLVGAIRLSKSYGIRFRVIGNTTNLLFSDDGYDGALIFTKKMNAISLEEDKNEAIYTCECGASLPHLSTLACQSSHSGFEFFCGIPASVGGAVCMNAGAHGGEISDILISSRVYDITNDVILELDVREHDFSYRHSIFAEREDMICLSAKFRAYVGDSEEIKKRMQEYRSRRSSTQPIDMASAGSYFKRPAPDVFAPKLIQDCGLKGYSVGGAQISKKHSGFIVNLGGATASDVLSLASYTRKEVLDATGIALEAEVIYIDSKG